MKTTILKQSLILLSSATLLAACGGDGGDSPVDDGGANPGESGNQSLLYSYPDDGQSEIATRAPIVLRFSSRVSTNAAEQNIILRREADGTELGFSAEEVPGEPRGVVLQPDEELDPHTRYVIDVPDLALSGGPSADKEIHFSTRALQRGPKNLVITDSDFELSRTFPSGGEQEPVMDFSTFRFQFTQPIDPATARYGQGGDATVTLTDSEGNLIEAALLVDGPYMTVDPEPEHLDTKTEYTLTLAAGLNSTFEQGFAGDSVTFTPKDSSPRGEPTIMVQRITEAVKPSGEPNRSELTGAPVNEVPVNSTLLGEDSATRSSGDVRAELADVTQYTEVTPVRIPRSTILTGTNIDVMIGGAVPAGISSGAVKMHFLSDATGYLVPNPYADNRDDALRIVRLFMDVAISTENAEANGGFTQDLLHIELIGTAEVDPQAGVLNLDAVSMVEPDVLGQEFATGLLSFQLQSYKDQTNPPTDFADTTPPTLQSWTLADNTSEGGPDKSRMAKPGDPIILNFSEPLDRQSISGKIHLYRAQGGMQTDQNISVHVDGSAIVISPNIPLSMDEQTSDTSYTLTVDQGLTDLAGNELGQIIDHTFSLPHVTETWKPFDYGFGGTVIQRPEEPVDQRSPFILGLYPGYPCVFDPATVDLANGISGRCRGGIPPNDYGKPANDLIPTNEMPANRPIIVVFSKDMNLESISLNTTFIVEKIDNNGQVVETVPGELKKAPRQIVFNPQNPWDEGGLYRYTMVSNGDISSSTVDCSQALCGASGLPLQTQLLANITIQPGNTGNTTVPPELQISYKAVPSTHLNFGLQERTGGGPDITQYFKGVPRTNNVLQLLTTAPISDANANLRHDAQRDYRDGSGGDFEDRSNSTGYRSYDPNSSSYRPHAAFDGVYQLEETGPSDSADESTATLTDAGNLGYGNLLDPNGVEPTPNSAKILSSRYGIAEVSDWPYTTVSGFHNVGANIGCGYYAFEGAGEQTCIPNPFGGDPFCSFDRYQAKPNICPNEKFTYLTGVLFAEVTSEVAEDGALLTYIHPGRIATTSFMTFARGGNDEAGPIPIQSGYQVMRMRYAENEQGLRRLLIPAAITPSSTEGSELSTSVDLYLDAPLLWGNMNRAVQTIGGPDHNFFSYETALDLSGGISFLNDGRMVVEQKNLNRADFYLRGNQPAAYIDIFIPKEGSYLKYVSEPIK